MSPVRCVTYLSGSDKRFEWRRGWDLNPRYGFPYARFRGECFQPLSHLSAVGSTRLSDGLASRQRDVTQFEIQPALRSISCATSLNERFSLARRNPLIAQRRLHKRSVGVEPARTLAAGAEELLQNGSAFFSEQTCGDFDLMI